MGWRLIIIVELVIVGWDRYVIDRYIDRYTDC
jgi:hypothetical protein